MKTQLHLVQKETVARILGDPVGEGVVVDEYLEAQE